MTPTEITSMAKIAAASGVPNNAAKAALMPVIIIIFWSLSLSFSHFAKVCPMDAPI